MIYSSYLNITHYVERLSDHSVNLFDSAKEFVSKNITLNKEIVSEIVQMKEISLELLKKIFRSKFI